MFKPQSRPSHPGPSTHTGSDYPEVKLNRRRSRSGSRGPGRVGEGRWPWRLNFYSTPPSMDVTLEEFETFAIARLKVLCHLHSLSDRSLPPSQIRDLSQSFIKQHLNLSSNTARNAKLEEERRADEVGHWVLRLGFCRSPDLREKFIKTESELFRLRYESDDAYERGEFLKSMRFGWVVVDDAEKRRLKDKLITYLSKSGTEEQVMNDTYVKVPWYSVPDLVSTRRVYIAGGNAYVPQTYQISLVLQTFRERLGKALDLTAKSLPRLDEDDRLLPILSHLSSSFLSNITSSPSTFFGDPDGSDGAQSKVTAEMVDNLAKRHFPACQYNLWRRLKRDRHLKHFGRLQFGLFLKALGLPLDEAVVYWRRAFGTTMSDDKFSKEYKYNIRHSYGQEGKRVNYPAKNCQQILTGPQPGPQESHGCPYRTFSPEALQSLLVEAYPIIQPGSSEMKEILDQVKKTHYHVACTRVFELTHQGDVKKGEGMGEGVMVTHPNEYYVRSLGYERGNAEKKTKEEGEAMQLD